MVFSQVPQPRSTYLTWVMFKFPTPDGSVDAIAIPATARNQLNSVYTLLARSAIANVWVAVLAVGMYMYLRLQPSLGRHGGTELGAHPSANSIMLSIWNSKESPRESLSRVAQSVLSKDREVRGLVDTPEGYRHEWWFYPLVFALVVAWAANVLAGVIIPGNVFIGNGAPVDPTCIYVPSSDAELSDHPNLIKALVLDAASSLRAVGGVLLSEDLLRDKVLVGQPVARGKMPDGQPVQQIAYSYSISGADLGLQRYPDLMLNTTGACTTDYTMHIETRNITVDGRPTHQDIYRTVSGNVSVSVQDGRAPSATFLAWDVELMNVSWAAVVSSVDRPSSTPGNDPWYTTGPNPMYNRSDANSAPYTVLPARPVLLCWQNDAWSYRGQTSDISRLTSEALPGLHLSKAMQSILQHYLLAPRIYNVGNDLGPSTLQSATYMVGNIMNGDDSSIRADLQRLLYASYIATMNTLTDTTLHPPTDPRKASVPNMVLDELGRVLPGVGDFVVYTDDVATLSLRHLVAIPCCALGSWLFTLWLLSKTPLCMVEKLDITALHAAVREYFPDLGIDLRGNDTKWVL